jgi:predicted KAP-like P-loop ATPase
LRAQLNGASANVIIHFDPISTSENDSMGDFGIGKSCLVKRYFESSKFTAKSIPIMERKCVDLEDR